MEKNKKSIFKKWWVWVIIVLVISSVGSATSEQTNSSTISDSEGENRKLKNSYTSSVSYVKAEEPMILGESAKPGKPAVYEPHTASNVGSKTYVCGEELMADEFYTVVVEGNPSILSYVVTESPVGQPENPIKTISDEELFSCSTGNQVNVIAPPDQLIMFMGRDDIILVEEAVPEVPATETIPYKPEMNVTESLTYDTESQTYTCAQSSDPTKEKYKDEHASTSTNCEDLEKYEELKSEIDNQMN
jgi:hypothetical protein